MKIPPTRAEWVVFLRGLPKNNPHPKAVGHRERSASKRIFFCNTSSKSHGRRQPCRGFSSRLAEKISLFEVLCSFAAKIFSCNELRGRGNTWCIARTRRKLRGKRWPQNRINPYDQPPKWVGIVGVFVRYHASPVRDVRLAWHPFRQPNRRFGASVIPPTPTRNRTRCVLGFLSSLQSIRTAHAAQTLILQP